MRVIKITPRGYCYGVVDAMTMATRAVARTDLPHPIYILGMIVHNQYVVDAFKELGVITLDGENRLDILEEIHQGTVIFTAHGVSPAVVERAQSKGLTVIDATCPDVMRTHALIRDKAAQGYHVVYIGRPGHPEPEGAVGVAPDSVHLVGDVPDVDRLPDSWEKVIITNQTTMSQWDTRDMVDRIIKRFPHAEVYNEICHATQIRQDAVASQSAGADLCIVVGDPRSNNSGRLAQVAEEIAHVPSHRVSDVTEIDPAWLMNADTVAVTAGASTPTPITKEVIAYLEAFDPTREETFTPMHAVEMNLLPIHQPKHGTLKVDD